MNIIKLLFALFIATYAFLVHFKASALGQEDQALADIIMNIKKDMVMVEGGSFDMGSHLEAAQPRELPVHKVTLDSFYIQKTEVTQAQFEAVMGWDFSFFKCSDCPVNNISWNEIQTFIEKLNKLSGFTFRFPTEAEWEFAARGGKKSQNYVFSGSDDIDKVAWFANNAKRKLHPVAQKQANELGLYDMTGNVWEFVADDMSRKAYQHSVEHNPIYLIDIKKGKKLKVMRGSGYEFGEQESDVFKRDGATNNVRLPDVGFRLAMSN